MFNIALSFLILLPAIISARKPQVNLTLVKPSLLSGSLIQVDHDLHFSNCDLHVDKDALYVCSRHVYLLSDKSSRPRIERTLAINAEMDNNSLIVMEPSNIEVYLNYNLIDHIFYHRETPLLSKVKSKSTYALIVTVTKSRPHTLEALEESSLEDQSYERIYKNQDDFEGGNYFIVTFLRGSIPISHRTRIHKRFLNFEPNDNSFKEAVIYSDPLYGHDYFILGLERSWLMIFKSVFQGAEMNFLSTKQIKEGFEILEMRIVDSYLFVLLKNALKKDIRIVIYKLESYDGFILREECMLGLNQYFHSGYSPQLRVKLFDGVFALMVNFPGEQIVVYHFQKPATGVLPLNCKKESATIVYKNAIDDIKIGYSFDYIVKSGSNAFKEHRILLSPITLEGKSTFYIPYCMPNTYRDPVKGCIPCESGFSFGGFNATCFPCSMAFDRKSDFFERSDIIEKNCPIKCDLEGRFGKNCLACSKYMEASKAVLPKGGYWGINDNKECGLQCREGLQDDVLGACLDIYKRDLMKDPCSQVKDCMNCSMSQTCSWIQGSCRQKSKGFSKASKALYEDVLLPTLKCGTLDSCGSTEYTNASGILQFSASTLYKNQLCKWHLHPYDNQNNRIELKVTVGNELRTKIDNLPTIFIQTYNYNMSGTRNEYSLSKLTLKKGTTIISLIATELVLFPHIEENIPDLGQSIKIEYKIRPINNLLESVLVLFKWIYYLIFLSIAFTCTITSVQKITNYYRRRKLLLQLQGIVLDELDITEERHHVLDVEKVLNNQKVVSKVVHDEIRTNKYQQTECSICLEEFKNGENLAEFACNHVFHVKCFETWVKAANFQGHVKCPVCNRILI